MTVTTTSDRRPLTLPRAGIVLPVLLFAGLAAVPLFGDGYTLTLVSRAMIFGLAAVSLDLILGCGGLVSFGHAAFLGVGAYAIGILASHGIGEAAITFPIAALAAGAFALLTGWVSLRTRGVHFIMITLAFAQMIYFTATSLSAYGGDDGLTLWSRSTLFGADLLEDDTIFYYAVFGVLLAGFLFTAAVARSRFGRVLRGARESEMRMRALGFDPLRFRLVAYGLAGALAGLSGALLANQAEFVSPAYMTWQRSGELIIMVVLGGMGTLWGAILGALAYILAEDFLPALIRSWRPEWAEHWRLLFGPLLIVIVLFTRGGLAALTTARLEALAARLGMPLGRRHD